MTVLLADIIIGTKLTTTDRPSSSETCLMSGQVYQGGSQRKIQPRSAGNKLAPMINKSDHKTNYRKNLLLKLPVRLPIILN